jgi:hypothetical protein
MLWDQAPVSWRMLAAGRKRCLGCTFKRSRAARAQMDGDALAFVEHLDAAGGQPRLDLGAGEAVAGHFFAGL